MGASLAKVRLVAAPEFDYSDVLSGLPVGLYRSTPSGQILDATPPMIQMLGYPSREALLAVNAGDLYVNPEDRRRWQALIERDRVLVDFETPYPREDVERLVANLANPRPVLQSSGEWRHRRKNGQVIDVQIESHAMQFAGHNAVLVVAQDITDRKRAEEALAESEEQYRYLFENANDAIFTIDLKGNFTTLNKAAELLSGYLRGEALQKNCADVWPPDDLGTERAIVI